MRSRDLPVRVAVVSGNQLVRAGLVSLIAQLEQRAVVTEVAATDERLGHHDVAIYDLGAVRGPDSYDDLQRLVDSGVQVIALVYDVMRDTVPAALGASTHTITLSVTPEQLMDVLRRTTPPRQGLPRGQTELQLPGGLTDREFQVIELVGAGLTNQAIAEELYISVNSVKSYIRTAYRKIGAPNRSSAMLWALRHGLAGGPDHT